MPAIIRLEGPTDPEVLALLTASDAYYAELYPAESNHLVDPATLAADASAFFVARLDGSVAGFGALLLQDGYAEIKRMFVDPRARGQRLGKVLLETLERHARNLGIALLRLETGIKQPEAIGLYRSAGFREIEPFGKYGPDPLSIFMEKSLTH
ncbi:GNAT family N-acetyltransferase [Dongia sp.]|uniref:GNAT family N-acetyltransferase n=1 Tax=Dongia sp. TaxID=1977262 RepID=UPI0035B29C42